MPPVRIIVSNRRARRDYEIIETVECGIVLLGSEVKSVKAGMVSIAEAYAEPIGGEIWLMDMHVAQYPHSGPFVHEPTRPRKLLLRKNEIKHLIGKVSRRGYTLIPLSIYIKRGFIKLELGLAKGRKKHEKRDVIKRREAEREIRKELRG
ncbi:MAG: SsrA-binding protein SmpB [candidate division WOR-3 bacterium]